MCPSFVPWGSLGRVVGTVQEGSFSPHFTLSLLQYWGWAFLTPEMPSSEICTGEMVIAPLWCFSEYHIHKKWRSHCCVFKLESMIGFWGVWLVAVSGHFLVLLRDPLTKSLSIRKKFWPVTQCEAGDCEPCIAQRNDGKFPVTTFPPV